MGKDEVEEMLREAEDDALLKLTLNSHTVAGTSSSPSPLDSDLARRFEALKSTSTAKIKPPVSSSSSSASSPFDDDLTARFAALKTGKSGAPPGDLHPPNSLGSQDPPPPRPQQQVPEKDDDKVEAVMRWAMDAVRLGTPDPTGTTSSDDEDEDEDDEDEDMKEGHEKKKKEKQGNPAVEKSKKHGKEAKKWIFF